MTSSKRKTRFKKRIGRKELKKREWETKALKKLSHLDELVIRGINLNERDRELLEKYMPTTKIIN